MSPPAAVTPSRSASARIASASCALPGRPPRLVPGEQGQDLGPLGRRGAGRQLGEHLEHLAAQRRDGAALGVRAQRGDHAVAVAALADEAGLAGHRQPRRGERRPASRGVAGAPQVVLGGRQEHRFRCRGGVEQARGERRLGDERGRRLVDVEVLGRAPQLAHPDAAGAQHRRGVAVQVSARASTRRSGSSTAVVPRRSRSAGVRSTSADAGGLGEAVGRAGASRRASPTSRGSSTRWASMGTSRPRLISRCGGGRSVAGAASGCCATRADRRADGEPVEHVPFVGVGSASRSPARRVGEQRGHGRAGRGCAAGGRPSVRSTGTSCGVGHAGEQRGGRAAEPGRVRARPPRARSAVRCTRSGSPQISARSNRSSSAVRRRRRARRSSSSPAARTRFSRARSVCASRPSTARCVDVRTPSRPASDAMSGGAGRARSGRSRSSAASSRSVRARSHSVSEAARRAGRRRRREWPETLPRDAALSARRRGWDGRPGAGARRAACSTRQRELGVAERRVRPGGLGH